ncbi:TetR family transcriptional regulator [Rhizobium sp. TH2]|uniref:TetR/AcrR family transcriptional regulator n=1 Tax=Rhizobium sp. TH2 TaxID=2775403 RepID=UPI00215860FC|nr:TetR/AcrR family transcriptional regulator [Rhizobium sp. TH2]UVC09691.1 TetR family transcriptional regulator [Rhizobium sp. TH2]
MRYEKGRKDASRRQIMKVASERFRCDGIAASGLASVMSDAGLTNGAFYAHFDSKAELVRETVAAALEDLSKQVAEAIAAGGLAAAVGTYLSAEHRDDPAHGCSFAALLPELARQPAEARQVYTERFLTLVRQLASALPPQTGKPEDTAMAMCATLIGTLQLARIMEGRELSARMLTVGADAALRLAEPRQDDAAA